MEEKDLKQNNGRELRLHCKKRLVVFPSPAVMSLTKLSLAGNYSLLFEREELSNDLYESGWGTR
jgi:hypothetical protein